MGTENKFYARPGSRQKMNNPLHVISLGAGVQSSTMALMAAHGEIGPMPECAIFADTQQEPQSVYDWLDWLEKQLPFQVYRISRGDLGVDSLKIRKSKNGNHYTKSSPPAFIVDGHGNVGLLKRQCTSDYKITPIHQKLAEIRDHRSVIQWIGISLDEAHRMKPSRKKWIENRYPLIEQRIHRQQCIEWMEKNNYPRPPRSACIFCPYHSPGEWLRLKQEEPAEFEKAVAYELKLQETMKHVTGFFGKPYLHRSCKPLNEIDFKEEAKSTTIDMFGDECEGICGV